MTNNKTELRKKLIASRMAVAPEVAKQAAESLAGFLSEAIPTGAVVAGYAPIRGEIALNIKCHALPVIGEGSKILRFLDCSGELVLGKYGIPCSAPDMPEIIPDTLIVPMVGFDTKKNRLGYGGGYYDATIRHLRATNPKLLVIGVAYDMQKIEHIAHESHDEMMDLIVTEAGIYK